MTIEEGLKTLLNVEQRKQGRVVASNTIAVGVARAGSNHPVVKADIVKELTRYHFGSPPHSLVFLGKLHFMEAEALLVLAKAPESVKELVE